jgi:hypothetical protein
VHSRRHRTGTLKGYTCRMRVTALGVGDAFSCLYYSTCLLVEHGGARLLID